MIKSSKSSILFSNSNKLMKLYEFIDEYKNVVSQFVDILWQIDDISRLISKDLTSQISSTWLSARAIQSAAKQASGIVRGTRAKQKRRLFIISKLVEEKKFKQARKLQRIYDETSVSKPNIQNVEPELDSRFVSIHLETNETSFDGWIHLSSLGNKITLDIPFKKHKHFNKLLVKGVLKKGIHLSKKNITFMFDIPDPEPITDGVVLGIDIGQTTTLSCSNGQVISECPHGHTYKSICNDLSRKTKDSKGFKRKQKHRTNYLHWVINQLNLVGVKQVNRENIQYLRKGKKTSKSLQHWNYGELFDGLSQYLCDLGVREHKLDPTYTSQRCSSCGWVRKGNRKGKKFTCNLCSYEHDADLNASSNLSFELEVLSPQQRLLHKNRQGFYWLVSQESIVPDTKEIIDIEKIQLQ